MGAIRRSFKHLDGQMFSKLFKALVRPHLEYANCVWSPSLKKDITALENVQRRATKQVPGMRDLSYPERLKALELPTLVYRRLRGDMIEVYKILSNVYDSNVADILHLHSDHVARKNIRGNSKKLFKMRARLNVRKHFFTHRVVEIWNQLPNTVVEAPSVFSFERRLDKLWKNQGLVYDYKECINKSLFLPAGMTNNDSDAEDLCI